jgi:hypothetical protein
MLLINRSKDLWKMCVSSLCSIDKLSFASFSVFGFLLYYVVPNIFFCFSYRQRHHEEGKFFSEYDQNNWFLYVEYYLEVFSY